MDEFPIGQLCRPLFFLLAEEYQPVHYDPPSCAEASLLATCWSLSFPVWLNSLEWLLFSCLLIFFPQVQLNVTAFRREENVLGEFFLFILISPRCFFWQHELYTAVLHHYDFGARAVESQAQYTGITEYARANESCTRSRVAGCFCFLLTAKRLPNISLAPGAFSSALSKWGLLLKSARKHWNKLIRNCSCSWGNCFRLQLAS